MNNFDASPLNATQTSEDNVGPDRTYPDYDIDPDFTYPDSDTVVPPYDEDIDPDFSVIPPYYPDNIVPDFPPYVPDFGVPCIFCNNNQWVRGAIRFLNATTGYNPFTVLIDNRTVYTGLGSTEITQYRQITQGYHTFTVMGNNRYIYFQKSMYVGDGMATIAIVNAVRGLDLISIEDTACPTTNSTSCFRVCNLAYYSGPVNVAIGNVYFNAVNFPQATSFSSLDSGGYTLRVARSARPEAALLTMGVTLNPRRVYTLYVLNWNASTDAIRTLLVEDRRN